MVLVATFACIWSCGAYWIHVVSATTIGESHCFVAL